MFPTPIIDLSRMSKNPNVNIYGKCEYMLPTNSTKYRLAQYMIEWGEKKKLLNPNKTIIAASSGNTGSAIAYIAKQKGYKSLIVTTSKCSIEKQQAIKDYGAEIVIIDNDYIKYVTDLASNYPEKYFDIDQYSSTNNSCAYENVGREIYEQLPETTHLFAGAGTGGSISGVGRILKQLSPIKIVLTDPISSNIWKELSCSKEPLTKLSTVIEGVGKDKICNAFTNKEIIDEVMAITDEEAIQTCHNLRRIGINVGGSSGLVIAAAIKASESLSNGSLMCMLIDAGFKYESTIYKNYTI